MSQDWLSDSDDSDKFEWEGDGEAEPSSAPALRNLDAAGPSTLVRQVVTDKRCLFQHKTSPTCYYLVIIMIFVLIFVHVTVQRILMGGPIGKHHLLL